MGVRHMQGVPAHIEVLHDKEHKKRHMARCKNIIKPEKTCDYPKSPYFERKCGGASHCKFYREV